MSLSAPTEPGTASPVTHRRVRLGWLLVLPAAMALLVTYVWPTLRTGWLSQRGGGPPPPGRLSDEAAAAVAAERSERNNYQEVLESVGGPVGSFPYLLALIGLLLLTLLVVAPALAWAGHQAGRVGRWTLRLGLAVPMACVVPAGLAAGWVFERVDGFPRDMSEVSGTAVVAMWLTTFGLVCGVGVTGYLAALRGGPGTSAKQRRGAVLTVAGLAYVAVPAVVLQVFTYWLATRRGPSPQLDEGTPPVGTVFFYTLVDREYGPAAAQSVLMLLPLMMSGLVAAALVILTRLRVEVAPPQTESPSPSRRWAVVATGLGLAAVLAVTVYGLWPWLSHLGFGDPDPRTGDTPAMLARTWLPPLVSTVVGVGLAAVAAFGIGALRPLGRRSELLLLPFAPWLFVGVGPLLTAKFETVSTEVGSPPGGLLGLIPPTWLAVPVLFLLTPLFRGLVAGRPLDGTAGSYRRVAGRALPMVGLLAGATWLVQTQSPLWSRLATSRWEDVTAPVLAAANPAALVSGGVEDGGIPGELALGTVLPVPLLLLFAAALVLVQLRYLDRLAIRVGREPESTG